jgi:hypothetical protein
VNTFRDRFAEDDLDILKSIFMNIATLLDFASDDIKITEANAEFLSGF